MTAFLGASAWVCAWVCACGYVHVCIWVCVHVVCACECVLMWVCVRVCICMWIWVWGGIEFKHLQWPFSIYTCKGIIYSKDTTIGQVWTSPILVHSLSSFLYGTVARWYVWPLQLVQLPTHTACWYLYHVHLLFCPICLLIEQVYLAVRPRLGNTDRGRGDSYWATTLHCLHVNVVTLLTLAPHCCTFT